MLDPDNNVPLEEQYDILTEEEQKRLLEKLVVENEADIKTFSTFLKMPTVAILVMNLVFIYNYATGGLGSSAHMNGAKLPVVGVSIYSEHPVVGTELSVVILQFTFYLLSTERWDSIAKAVLGIFMAAGSVHAVTCRKSGIFEFIWWLLPVLNLAIASYAQLNMRRSRQEIEKLAKKTYHVKSA
ncbi:hypothetical protein BX661DRAFT_169264 [Kickxella alabastrina]|uniref:uncharacterized protein n=1 Tax=Kickxella alabastrina TaxID=61397 RepID=UPI002220A878|nr:uncharacterized protein BX661DRAFT_169264 [Kickxella alabastrina]KAI7833423.1 hypothetical protein BX661DRAFT_169264 [Kickxella alabastrina]